MARKLWYIPDPRTLVFITCRTVQGRFLLRPGPVLNDIVLGVLGRCQRNYDLTLCAVTVLSSHIHVLAVVDDARQIAGFMRDVKSKLAREGNRLTDWKGHVFERRYDMAVVTEEEGAQSNDSRISWPTGSRKIWWSEPGSGLACNLPGLYSTASPIFG
jgi:REP element-mobilizing transposase RayT